MLLFSYMLYLDCWCLDLLCIGTCQNQWRDFTRNPVELVAMASAHTAGYITADVTAILLPSLSRKILYRKCVVCWYLLTYYVKSARMISLDRFVNCAYLQYFVNIA